MDSLFKIFNNRLKKKSQLTMVIIAGFIVLLLVVSTLYITEFVQKERLAVMQLAGEEFQSDVDSISNYISKCVRDVGHNGLELLGKQGGHISIPPIIDFFGKSYWYYDQVNIQPTLEEINQRLKEYIDLNAEGCSDLGDFVERGFLVESGDLSSFVVFDVETVSVNVTYPITIQKGEFVHEFDSFYSVYTIRFRRAYEMATQLLNKHYEDDFDVYSPLALVDQLDFHVTHRPYNETTKIIEFNVTDETRYEYGKHYEFKFVSKLNNTQLPAGFVLPPNSDDIPTLEDLTVVSPDGMAGLDMPAGVFVDLNGDPVGEIVVEQSYPPVVVIPQVVVYNNDGTLIYSDFSFDITNPVYEFSPDGTTFSEPLRLTLYWDDEVTPNQGEVGILADRGNGWEPIDSNPNYVDNSVWTDITGFSEHTPVDCGAQGSKVAKVKAEADAGWFCWVRDDEGEECITFTPTCDQAFPPIHEDDEDVEEGECRFVPRAAHGVSMEGGRSYKLCADIDDCSGSAEFWCGECELECRTNYK